ncbi:hypothetical protein N0V93_009747 [Gnomoniopsis smithogilvyi]|uniref:AB hydrolase-1 domain-containing protein n=1 Tax=Gnomoniopsis smithogilvyi TaxID=1191159 RepID=A0A9W9CU34_9PEZI|nr:hypothetical protein N0V93_009747 [Gnomoniopsis smithogilvyi]
MARTPSAEGHIPFEAPGILDVPCSTYYKVFGELACGAPPVIFLHGGPGGGHEYLLSFAELWPQYGLPVILYDQIGCGASTHLPQKAGDKDFWQESLFIAELDNLIDHLNLREGPGFHIFGQSWGGMLGVAFAARQPRGLQRLVLASGLASMDLSEKSIQLCRSEMPRDLQEVLEKSVQESNYTSQAYRDAMAVFQKMFVCRADPLPEELMLSLKHLVEDRTVYGTMYGPSVLDLNGSLRSWTGIPRLAQIATPTLVYNGEFDTSRDISQEPLFERIPRVRWIAFHNGSHMCHLDGGGLRERVLKVVGEFFVQHQAADKVLA